MIILSWTPANAEPPLRIATEGAYPPFNYINEEGKLTGFDVDIALALCAAMGRQCTLQAVNWKNLIEVLREDRVDVVIASMAKTPEREEAVRFTDAYYRSRAAMAGPPGRQYDLTPEEMSGRVIATQSETVQEKYLNAHFKEVSTIITTPTIGESFKLLIDGKADLVLSDSLIIYDFLQTAPGRAFDFAATLPAEETASKAYIAVQKQNKGLANSLNRALKTIRLTGVYDKINRKYFPFSIY